MGVERVLWGGGVGWLGCAWLHRGSSRSIH